MRLLPKLYVFTWIMRDGHIRYAHAWATNYHSAMEKMLKVARSRSDEFANGHFFYRCITLRHLFKPAITTNSHQLRPGLKGLMACFIAPEVRKPLPIHWVKDYKVELKTVDLTKDEQDDPSNTPN